MLEVGSTVDNLPNARVLSILSRRMMKVRGRRSWCGSEGGDLADIARVNNVVDSHETRFGSLSSAEVDFVLHFCGEKGGENRAD